MPTDDTVEKVARAICKSRTGDGWRCCQWPSQGGRVSCTAKTGAYDDGARAALEAAEAGAVPVAWRWRYDSEQTWTLANREPKSWPDRIIEPLYASPPSEASREAVEWTAYTLTVEPQEDGTWLATCPDLPGCIATADTPDAALGRLRDVQASWLAVCHERGIRVPEPATAIRARGET